MKNINMAEQLEAVERIFCIVKAHFIMHEIRAIFDKWDAMTIEGPEKSRILDEVERIIDALNKTEVER